MVPDTTIKFAKISNILVEVLCIKTFIAGGGENLTHSHRGYSPSVCKENLEKETVFIIKTEISIKMSLFYN